MPSDIDRAIALLQRLEWVDTSGGEYGCECPSCGANGEVTTYTQRQDGGFDPVVHPPEPHRHDCELALLIGARRASP